MNRPVCCQCPFKTNLMTVSQFTVSKSLFTNIPALLYYIQSLSACCKVGFQGDAAILYHSHSFTALHFIILGLLGQKQEETADTFHLMLCLITSRCSPKTFPVIQVGELNGPKTASSTGNEVQALCSFNWAFGLKAQVMCFMLHDFKEQE